MYALSNFITDELLSGDIRFNPASHANVTAVVVASNRGRVWNVFDNPHHKSALLAAGLRPDTALPCAFRFLFRPRPEVAAMYQHTWNVLADRSALKIGIQIRVGDRVFKDDVADVSWESIAPFFACAYEIEKTRIVPGQAVLYYLTSDSLAVRRLAKDRLGDKLLTEVDTLSNHIACEVGNCDPDQQASALRRAVGDLLSFSMADYHVYSMNSGFGRLGAWLSFSWHHHYTIKDGTRRCGVDDYDDLRGVARNGAGI